MQAAARIPMAVITILVLASCGGDGGGDPGDAATTEDSFNQSFADAEAYPIIASSEIVVGENRFLVGLLDSNDAPIGSADTTMHIAFYDLGVSKADPVTETDMEFIETIPGQRGLYIGYVSFDSAGKWGAEVSVEGPGLQETVRTSFDVREQGTTPAIGAKVPASDTPTADDVEKLSEITTDDDPDPRFYEVSIRDSVRSGEPFVVVFATPKFCTSQVCAPTLDRVEDVSRGVKGVNFIHVEVYTNLDDPSDLKVVPAVKEWGLPTEPWVFVVDDRGRVVAKYEGTVAPGELEDALRDL